MNFKPFLLSFSVSLVFGMGMSSNAFAQSGSALPTTPPSSTVTSNRFSQEVSQVTQNKMRTMGFAANDPRYGATLDAMSKKAAERSAAVRVTNPALVQSTTPASWGTSFLGAVSNFLGAVSGYFVLSYFDPAGPFGWTYCPGSSGDKAACLLQRYGKSLPQGDPITTVIRGTPANFYCLSNSGSSFWQQLGPSSSPCPGVSSTNRVCGPPAHIFAIARAACPNVGRYIDYRQYGAVNNNEYLTRWRSVDVTLTVGASFDLGGQYANVAYPGSWGTLNLNVSPFSAIPTGGVNAYDQSCPGGSYRINNQCITPNPTWYNDDGTIVAPPNPDGLAVKFEDAVEEIRQLPLPVNLPADFSKPYGDNMLSAPLAPDLAPFFINDLWKDVADDPDYQGLPFPENNPVKKPDVDAYREAYPDYVPRIGDLVAPMPNPGNVPEPSITPNPYQIPTGQPSPVQNPNPVSPGTGGNPNNENTPDLGPDPGIGEPELEPIPEPLEILRPLLEMFPDLRSYQVPSHNAVCPKPTFDIGFLNVNTTMTAHCDILEDNRALFFSTMLLVWGVMAILIILTA